MSEVFSHTMYAKKIGHHEPQYCRQSVTRNSSEIALLAPHRRRQCVHFHVQFRRHSLAQPTRCQRRNAASSTSTSPRARAHGRPTTSCRRPRTPQRSHGTNDGTPPTLLSRRASASPLARRPDRTQATTLPPEALPDLAGFAFFFVVLSAKSSHPDNGTHIVCPSFRYQNETCI